MPDKIEEIEKNSHVDMNHLKNIFELPEQG